MEPMIRVEGVAKKFCRSLRRSMWYGMRDIARNAVGLRTQLDKLRKDEFWALQGIDLEVKRGEVLGVIGPNGSGKSTLLKLLNGIFWPDVGRVSVRGRVGALIEVGAGFHPMLSGRENIFVNGAVLGMSKREIDARFDDIVAFADIGDFLDMPVKHYSSGMFVRLGFAIAVHCHPDILLVDEVLAVGDHGFQTKCFNRIGELRKNGISVVLVSHNMHSISTFSDRILLLHKGIATHYASVVDGVKAYSRLFQKGEKSDWEKICSGNNSIRFFDVHIEKVKMWPGDSFIIRMNYSSTKEYQNVEIDTAIFSSLSTKLYFQATNRSNKDRVDFLKGIHVLEVSIEAIPIQNAFGKIAIAIWSQNRTELLFWWRIPVAFQQVPLSTGENHLNVSYEIQ